MLPGKKYKPEDLVAIAWSKRWFIILPFIVATVSAIAYAASQPDRYRSQTSIIVTPQQVPTNFVQSTITTMLADRLQMINQQILSRARLERIVEEFNLYSEMRSVRLMEDVIEQMRSDIDINIQANRDRRANTGAFTVSYESNNPRTALLVTERLASLFIRENLEDRAVLADATNQFLEAQLEEARRKLIDHEKKLEDYRLRYAGSLPTQVQSNLQGIQTTQMQLQSLAEATNRDRDRKLFLERSLEEARTAVVPPMTSQRADPAAGVTAPGSAAQRLEAARIGLRELELRLKPDHPDMRRAKRVVRDLEKEAETEALQRPVSDEQGGPAPLTIAERNRQLRIAAMEAELKTIDGRLGGRQADEQRLREALAAYQARVEATPARESELTELMRDYETLKATYNDLLGKSEASKLALNLERRQIGEQFKIVDGARLPEKPFSPDRPRIVGMGAVLGLGFGLALVALIEYRDSTLKTDDDVVTSLALPVLALIPAMVTRAEERSRVRRRRLVAVTSVTVAVLAVGALAWKLQLFERWVG
jgi:polysaccharide chain length determinant protein (PEP-CTERM system associated)